jgi:hypothetical protein
LLHKNRVVDASKVLKESKGIVREFHSFVREFHNQRNSVRPLSLRE